MSFRARFSAFLLLMIVPNPVWSATFSEICRTFLHMARGTWFNPATTSSGYGDLSLSEVSVIQAASTASQIPIVIFGSAARGERRHPYNKLRSIGKDPHTRSDTDYF